MPKKKHNVFTELRDPTDYETHPKFVQRSIPVLTVEDEEEEKDEQKETKKSKSKKQTFRNRRKRKRRFRF